MKHTSGRYKHGLSSVIIASVSGGVHTMESVLNCLRQKGIPYEQHLDHTYLAIGDADKGWGEIGLIQTRGWYKDSNMPPLSTRGVLKTTTLCNGVPLDHPLPNAAHSTG